MKQIRQTILFVVLYFLIFCFLITSCSQEETGQIRIRIFFTSDQLGYLFPCG